MSRRTVRLKKKGNSFEKLLTPILAMEKEYVQVGHFEEQGQHYSGFTYPELMQLHHVGADPSGEVEIPPRPLLDYVFFKNQHLKDNKVQLAIRRWGKRPPSEESNQKLLDDVGKRIAQLEKAMFGESPPLAPNSPSKPTNSPLVDTGSLRDKTSYKTSKSKSPKEV